MKKIKWSVFATVTILAAVSLYIYWHYQLIHPSTADAYVRANVVHIASQVSGPVIHIYVQDHQSVQQGDKLFEIDPAPYRIAVARAQAQLDLTHEEIGAAQAAVKTAQAQVRVRKAQLTDARKNYQRIQTLVNKGELPQSNGDTSRARLKSAEAELSGAESGLEQARRKLGKPGDNNARLRAAEAALANTKLDLEHTRITAPADSVIANLTLRVGTMVDSGVPLFALVEKHDWWVEANYKETDLERIQPGQPASISIDMYPSLTFRGEVESVSPASGVAFSLLPPENATGNWVKVTQRFPVKIRIENANATHTLRVGSSVQVSIDTTTHAPPGGSGT